MSAESPSHEKQLHGRTIVRMHLLAVPVAPLASYLLGLVLGLKGEEAKRAVIVLLPFIIIFIGNVYPHFLIKYLLKSAFRVVPDEAPGARLARLLKVPWHIAIYGMAGSYAMGGLLFGIPVCIWFDKSLVLGLVGGLVGGSFGMLLSFPIGLSVEQWILPHALEEQRRHPTVQAKSRGLFWLRQSWFQPYMLIVSMVSLLVMGGTVVGVQTALVQRQLLEDAKAYGAQHAVDQVRDLTSTLLGQLSLPLGLIAFVLLLIPSISAWMLARRQERGARAVFESIQRLSAGELRAPQWVASDEVGDLAFGLNSMLLQLRQIPETLNQSATRLSKAGNSLSSANDEQRRALTIQAAAVQQTSVTAQEIKQTSEMAAQRAENVVAVANRAEELGRSGSQAIEQSVAGFGAIRDYVQGIRAKMARLEASAQQISDITESVKELAAQSNLLAVNAAIEAARSGEQGKGFAVVAQEIRSLADQSLRSTNRIHRILREIGDAVRDAASLSDVGAAQVEGGLARVKASGDSLRQLSEIVAESSTAARQIAATVNQQNTGFSQIFTAISDLSVTMDKALMRLESTQQAADELQAISAQVTSMAAQYRSE